MKAERIQYIDTGRSFGGAERVTLALAAAFQDEGAVVECLIHPHADRFAEILGRRGIPHRPVVEANTIARIGSLASEFQRFHPDVVHLHRTWPLSDRYASPAAFYAGNFRMVTTEHVKFEQCLFRDRTAKKFLSAFDHKIVCVSDAVRQSLLQFWKIASSRLHIIPNGIDTGNFDRKGEGLYFPPTCRFRIGAVGRLEKQKDFSTLIDAMPEILEKEPSALLVIAGEGSLRDQLLQKAVQRGVEKSIRLEGNIPDVALFLAELDLFVLPSLWEGLPLTILEAMATACPIVATAVDGTVEALRQGEDGLLVPPGDPAALAKGCMDVMGSREEARARGERARKRAVELFSLAGMVEGYRQVYES